MKLKTRFKQFRTERERVIRQRVAVKEAFLKEKEAQEIKFAKKKAQFQAQEQFKQYRANKKELTLLGIPLQPMGTATGFEGSIFALQKQ